VIFSKIIVSLPGIAIWLAQIGDPDVPTPEDAALLFDGPQLFVAIIVGVLFAFAFQMLLTNFGVAIGISAAGGRPSRNKDKDKNDDGTSVRTIGAAMGIATLITVALALFFACFLAVKLSLLAAPGLGAIAGLAIWAAFFSLVVWFGSSRVGSFVGSVVGTATNGIQAIIGTAAAAIGGAKASQDVVTTAETAAKAVRKELTGAIDPQSLKEQVEDYLEALKPPSLDWSAVRNDVKTLLQDPSLAEAAATGDLGRLDRKAIADVVSQRSDLSKKEVERLTKIIAGTWDETTNRLPGRDTFSELVEFLKSGTRQGLLGSELTDKIDRIAEEMRKKRKSQSSGPLSRALQSSFHSLSGIVMGRTDLSDLDAQTIIDQLEQLKGYFGEQSQKIADLTSSERPSYEPLRSDIENYLRTAYPWRLKSAHLNTEFRDLLYDPDADPESIVIELEQWNRGDFSRIFQDRGLFTQSEIRSISLNLENIRREVLGIARSAYELERATELLADTERYILAIPKQQLVPEKLWSEMKPRWEDANASTEELKNRLLQLDRAFFDRILNARPDLNSVEANAVANELESIRDRVIAEAIETGGQARGKIENQWHKLQAYLRDTGKAELNPKAIERELKLLLDDPQQGVSALRHRASRFDRDTLVKLLSQRQDLSRDRIEDILDRVESRWTQVRYAPQALAGEAKVRYDDAMSSIADYLRGTDKAELNPDGIKRDISLLFEEPKSGMRAVRQRLASVDRDTLVQLLAQRDDLSEEEVNRVIDDVLDTLREIARTPRRLALRAKAQAYEFKDNLADYLRSTEKEELDPEGIRRDLELLVNDPRAGTESIVDRLSEFDRETFVQLLAQRDDMSQAEAEQVVDRILAVRDRIVARIEQVKLKVEAVIDRILAKIRDYLNGLERPELNYDGIKRDLYVLFDDPNAGFEAIRDRLSQVDRDTLVAVLSSREDISRADADRIIGRVELTRDRVLQKAERLQVEAQKRIEQMHYEAQKRMEATRKAAAAAAWWLFLTATISGATAALGGAVGVVS